MYEFEWFDEPWFVAGEVEDAVYDDTKEVSEDVIEWMQDVIES